MSEKDEKDKKRKVLTPVSATPTHMLRICVNPSFELFLSPRGDQCEQSAPTVRQLLNHGYRFETLKRRLGFAAVPCRAMANLAVDIMVLKLGSLCADGIWRQSVMHTSPVSLRLTPSAPVSATPTHTLRVCVNFPCLGDADTHAPRMCQFPSTTRYKTIKLHSLLYVPMCAIIRRRNRRRSQSPRRVHPRKYRRCGRIHRRHLP